MWKPGMEENTDLEKESKALCTAIRLDNFIANLSTSCRFKNRYHHIFYQRLMALSLKSEVHTLSPLSSAPDPLRSKGLDSESEIKAPSSPAVKPMTLGRGVPERDFSPFPEEKNKVLFLQESLDIKKDIIKMLLQKYALTKVRKTELVYTVYGEVLSRLIINHEQTVTRTKPLPLGTLSVRYTKNGPRYSYNFYDTDLVSLVHTKEQKKSSSVEKLLF